MAWINAGTWSQAEGFGGGAKPAPFSFVGREGAVAREIIHGAIGAIAAGHLNHND